MAKQQSFMMESKTVDIQKSKNELPNLPSKQNYVHVNYFTVTCLCSIIFLGRIIKY